jgi:hypothetical protein
MFVIVAEVICVCVCVFSLASNKKLRWATKVWMELYIYRESDNIHSYLLPHLIPSQSTSPSPPARFLLSMLSRDRIDCLPFALV